MVSWFMFSEVWGVLAMLQGGPPSFVYERGDRGMVELGGSV